MLGQTRDDAKRKVALASSFLPAPLRRKFAEDPRYVPHYCSHGEVAALLWCDITGFTPLSSRLLQKGVEGVEQLSELLRDHYHPLLNCITAHGGEPLLLVGDGLLSAWYCDSDTLVEATLQAVACGQEALLLDGAIDELGRRITIHAHVACGACTSVEAGGVQSRWLSVPVGEAMADWGRTTKTKSSDRVVLSPNAANKLDGLVEMELHETGCATVTARHVMSSSASALPSIPDFEALSALSSSVPAPVYASLELNYLQWVSELRRVTVVFAVLPDFDHVGPDASRRVQLIAQTVQPFVDAQEGALNQIWPDEKGANILITFGTPPAAHTDDSARGVNTALQLSEALAALGYEAHIAVTTGWTYCGVIGNDILRHYTVIGDAVNMAARLMMSAKGVVHCDEATMRACKDRFAFERANVLRVAGRARGLSAWIASRRGGEVQGVQELLIGRSAEMEAIEAQLAKAIRSDEGGGVIVQAESGFGKTKLVEAFFSHSAIEDTRKFWSAADQVERFVPYSGWRPIFASIFGISTVKAESEQVELLTKRLGERASLIGAIFHLQMPDPESVSRMSPEQRSKATFELLIETLSADSAGGPLLIVFDDAQWLDPISWFLLQETLERKLNLFFALTIHPGEAPTETLRLVEAGVLRVELGGLSLEAQRELICQTVGAESIDERVAQLVTDRANGHPFFCSELGRALIEDGVAIVTDGECRISPTVDLAMVSLPAAVQGAVTRRIDRLDPAMQVTLKVASAVGVRFPAQLIEDVYPIETDRDNVRDWLDSLCEHGLLEREDSDRAEEFTFRHLITRDVAYGLMLFDQRRQLHSEIGRWYEEQFSGDLSPHFAALAHHWEKSAQFGKATEYLDLEATRSFSLGLALQAVDAGRRAAKLLQVDLPNDPAQIGIQFGRHMADIARRLGDRKPADLLELPRLTDERVERLLWLLPRLAPYAFQSRQLDLFGLLAVTSLNLTLEHGLCPASADAFSLYSVVHRGITGNRAEAYQWSRLAIDLDAVEGGAMHARVGFVHGWFHNHWGQPLETSIPLAEKAAAEGFQAGDFLFACFNLSAAVIYMAALGAPLHKVIESARVNLGLGTNRVMNAAFGLILELQLAKALCGQTRATMSLSDDEYDEEKDIASILQTELGNQIGHYMVAKIKLHVHFGDWQGAMNWVRAVEPVLPAFEGQIAEVEFVLYRGLAVLQLAAESGTVAGPAIAEGRRCVETMQSWAGMCPSNYAHKADLLRALLEDVSGDYSAALASFQSAAVGAERSGFPVDAALAREHEARMHYGRGDSVAGAEALADALALYSAWGASAKVRYLREEFGLD